MAHGTTNAAMVTIGLDLGDRQTAGCVVDAGGQILERFQARTTPTRLLAAVTRWPGARVVLEVGGQSPWVSRRLQAAGRGGQCPAGAVDCRGRQRPAGRSCWPVGPGGPGLVGASAPQRTTQRDLGVESAGAAPQTGAGSPGAGAPGLGARRRTTDGGQGRPSQAVGATLPGITELLAVLEQLTASIRALDRQLATLATTRYPVTELLRQVPGVGPLTALTYVLTLEDPTRFPRSRTVGAYLGLRPKRRDSGAQQPELSITKAGDVLLRRHLVTAAQYILGPFGPDTDLRRWGLALAGRGGKAAKKRAVVAVARKLAVLLHRLWLTGEVYEPVGYRARAA